MDFDRIDDAELEEEDRRSKRGGCLWRGVKCFFALAFPLALLLALVPSLLCTAPGRQWALDWINRRIAPATLSCAGWELGWFSPAQFSQVSYCSPSDGISVEVPRVWTTSGLFKLLPIGRLNLGTFTVSQPVCTLFPPAETESRKSGGGFVPVADFALDCTVADGVLQVRTAEDVATQTVAEHLDGSVSLPSFWKPFAFKLQSALGQGRLEASGDMPSLFELCRGKEEFDRPQSVKLSMVNIRLAALRPLLVALLGDPLIADGTLHGDCNLTVAGQTKLSGKGKFGIKGLVLQSATETVSAKRDVSVNADFDVNGPELRFAPLEVSSPWMNFSAEGTLDSLTVTGDFDLTRFSREFSRAFNLPPAVGAVSVTGGTERHDNRLNVAALLKVTDFAVEPTPGHCTVINAGNITAKCVLPLDENGRPLRELTDGNVEMKLNGDTFNGSWQRYAWDESNRLTELRGLKCGLKLSAVNFAGLFGVCLPVWMREDLRRTKGEIIANAVGGTADGQTKLRLNAAGRNWRLDKNGGTWNIPDLRAEGALTVDGQQRKEVVADFSGSGEFVRDGVRLFAEEGMKGKAGVTVAADGKSVAIPVFDFSGSLGDCSVAATFRDVGGKCHAELRGEWAPDLTSVTKLLYAQGIDEFAYTGKERRKFNFSTTLGEGAEKAFTSGSGSGGLYVKSIRGLGLNAGAADLNWTADRGKLTFRYAPQLNGGKLDFRPSYTVVPKGTLIALPPQSQVMDSVAITQPMVDTLLVTANPFFQGSKVRKGTVSLLVDHFNQNTALPPESGLDASFKITFRNLEMDLGPDFDEILNLLHVKNRTLRAAALTVPVRLNAGRVVFDRTTIVLHGNQPITFYGWTAFDGRIAYTVEVPITEQLAGRTLASLFKGKTIKIPVTGTVTNANFDTEALKGAVSAFLKETLSEDNARRVSGFLEQLKKEFSK